MSLSEPDTHAKLIDPALHARGWTEDLIRREETAGAIEIHNGIPLRKEKGRADHLLRVRIFPQAQPVSLFCVVALNRLPAIHRTRTVPRIVCNSVETCRRHVSALARFVLV